MLGNNFRFVSEGEREKMPLPAVDSYYVNSIFSQTPLRTASTVVCMFNAIHLKLIVFPNGRRHVSWNDWRHHLHWSPGWSAHLKGVKRQDENGCLLATTNPFQWRFPLWNWIRRQRRRLRKTARIWKLLNDALGRLKGGLTSSVFALLPKFGERDRHPHAGEVVSHAVITRRTLGSFAAANV